MAGSKNPIVDPHPAADFRIYMQKIKATNIMENTHKSQIQLQLQLQNA